MSQAVIVEAVRTAIAAAAGRSARCGRTICWR